MKETKPTREWWITFKPYHLAPLGPCDNVMKFVASYKHEYGVHVREVSREYDAAVEGMREALADLVDHYATDSCEWHVCALAAFDAAKGLK